MDQYLNISTCCIEIEASSLASSTCHCTELVLRVVGHDRLVGSTWARLDGYGPGYREVRVVSNETFSANAQDLLPTRKTYLQLFKLLFLNEGFIGC